MRHFAFLRSGSEPRKEISTCISICLFMTFLATKSTSNGFCCVPNHALLFLYKAPIEKNLFNEVAALKLSASMLYSLKCPQWSIFRKGAFVRALVGLKARIFRKAVIRLKKHSLELSVSHLLDGSIVLRSLFIFST